MASTMTTARFGSAWLCACALAGCQAAGPFDAAWNDDHAQHMTTRLAAGDRAAPQRTSLDDDPPQAWASYAGRGSIARSRDSASLTFDEGSTVEDYAAAALSRHPSLRAAGHRSSASAAAIGAAGRLDDPQFQIAPLGEHAETAAGQVEFTAGLSQRIPWPGKLERARDAADHDARSVEEAGRQAAVDLAAAVRDAYWAYDFAHRAEAVVTAHRLLLDQFREVTEARIRTGRATQEAVHRLAAEIGAMDIRLTDIRRQGVSARVRLNTLMDRDVDAPLPLPDDASRDTVSPAMSEAGSADDWLMQAEQSPALAGIRERIEAARQRKRMATLDRFPDPTVFVNYAAVDDRGLSMAANGRDQWVVGLGFNIPLWQNRRDAAERAALQSMQAAISDLQSMHNNLAYAVREAFDRAASHQQMVRLYRETTLPRARAATDAALVSYRSGDGTFASLVDNWRTLLSYELAVEHHHYEMHRATTALWRAAGVIRPAAEHTHEAANKDVEDGEESEAGDE